MHVKLNIHIINEMNGIHPPMYVCAMLLESRCVATTGKEK